MRANRVVQGIAYGNKIYVAITYSVDTMDFPGEASLIKSSDGKKWTYEVTDKISKILGVTFGGGKFVAVGLEGGIYQSSDGEDWKKCNSGTTKPLHGVVYGKDVFVAVGDGGTILESKDGYKWVACKTGTNNNFESVCYGNGMYITAGGYHTTAFSSDGVQWTVKKGNAKEGQINGVTYGEGSFWAVANQISLLKLKKNMTWEYVYLREGGMTLGVSYGNGTIVGIGTNPAMVRYVSKRGNALTIDATNLHAGTNGVNYSATLEAYGGRKPYAWNATGLPLGLILDETKGTVSGVPAQTGNFTVALEVSDVIGEASMRQQILTINPRKVGTIVLKLDEWYKKVQSMDIDSKKEGIQTSATETSITGTVSDTAFPIGKITLSINGKIANIMDKNKDGTGEINYKLKLKTGKNEITIKATDPGGNSASGTTQVVYVE